MSGFDDGWLVAQGDDDGSYGPGVGSGELGELFVGEGGGVDVLECGFGALGSDVPDGEGLV